MMFLANLELIINTTTRANQLDKAAVQIISNMPVAEPNSNTIKMPDNINKGLARVSGNNPESC